MANLIQGDAFHIPLADGSAHCVVTSPPYHGLRKYAGEQGDDPLGLELLFDCGAWMSHYPQQGLKIGKSGKVTKWWKRIKPPRSIPICGQCHVCKLTSISREIWRTLREDGVFWLNYSDSWYQERLGFAPHTIARALVADGWWPRDDTVWYKRNPMPESVNGRRWQRERTKKDRSKHAKEHNIKGGTEAMLRDASIHQGIGPDWLPEYEYGPDLELRRGSWRHTRAHEYVFMLVKGMQYWSDQEAVREAQDTAGQRHEGRSGGRDGYPTKRGFEERALHVSGRNPRSVLDIPTAPYRGAHYATFPPALIAPLMMATCPRWCCPVCGQGWAPVVEHSLTFESGSGKAGNFPGGKWDGDSRLGTNDMRMGPTPHNQVLGHRPTCDHPHSIEEAVPGIVFDPFVGSGTTVMVAQQLLRRGIGLDISRPYLDEQAILRTGGVPELKLDDLPLFRDNGSG